jgi:hypothetical protein
MIFMVTIPERNFLRLAMLSLIGSFAVCGGIAYGVYKITDKLVFEKMYNKTES